MDIGSNLPTLLKPMLPRTSLKPRQAPADFLRNPRDRRLPGRFDAAKGAST